MDSEVSFEVQKQTELLPFSDPASQKVLTAWCEVHDGIVPKIVDRKNWGANDKKILVDRPDGKKDLEIPADTHLWELLQVISTIDVDSFKDGKREYKGTDREVRLKKLGTTFEDAAVYLAKRLDHVDQGQSIAKELITGFYKYGKSLQAGEEYTEEININKVAEQSLDETQTQEIDMWLAGKEYQFLKSLTDTNPQSIETKRQEMLSKYFRISEELLKREQRKEKGKGVSDWYLDKLRQKQDLAITTPVRELDSSIYDRGMETLMNGMMSKLESVVAESQKTVHEKLNTSELKSTLDNARSALAQASEADKEAKLKELVSLELTVGNQIQNEISNLTYKTGLFKPTEMVAAQALNCIGFSMLGGTLFDEVGLKYVSTSVPDHSILMQVTSDNTLKLMDMQGARVNRNITEFDLAKNEHEKRSNIVDQIAMAVNNGTFTYDHFMLKIDQPGQNFLNWPTKEIYVSLAHGNQEYKAQIYFILGNALTDPAEKEKCYRKAIELDPNYDKSYNGLGNALTDPAEKEKCYRKVIELDANNDYAYNALGIILTDPAEKEKCYRKAIEINKTNDDPHYNLATLIKTQDGRTAEAIEHYKEFRKLSKDEKFREYARQNISRLGGTP